MNSPGQHLSRAISFLGVTFLLLAGLSVEAAAPVVSNVRSAQRAGTQLVDVTYDVADADSATLTVSIAVSTNGGASYTLPATSFTGALGVSVTPGANRRITWNAGQDWPNRFSANVRFRVTASDDTAPSGMALIPAGSFTMGNTFSGEGFSGEVPTHTVYVSAFYLDRTEVTKALWDEVYNWAITHDYSFAYEAQGKANNHPVHSMTWDDAVKWCNARSEKEGRVPAYYTDAGLSVRYRTDEVAPYVNWSGGYRLPTEAEWEKAARGGANGPRFPWGDTDNITHSRANYYSDAGYAYDASPTRGYHPAFNDGVYPYTSPAGCFAANGYGLYDMAGNVREWCWDWYGAYSSGTQTDPSGPTGGSYRVLRGGSWDSEAFGCRAAGRSGDYPGAGPLAHGGFRSVLPSGQPSGGSQSDESPAATVDTRGASLSSLAISGPGTVNGGTVAAYQCVAWFSDGSSADVSDSAVWSVVGGNAPAGTFFSLSTLTVGNVDTARAISIRASYTLRNVSGNVTRSSPTLSVTLQPTFHVAFHPEPQSPGTANRTLTFTATPSGHQPPVTYSWDLDNDGQFDDQTGMPATYVFPDFGQFTVRLKAVDSLGRTAVAVGSVSVDRLAPDSPPTRQAAMVEMGEILDLNGNPFVFDTSRTNAGLIIITHGLCSSAHEGWPAEMGRAIEQQLAASGPPNICLYNWEAAANPVGWLLPGNLECGELYREIGVAAFLANVLAIRPIANSHGDALADWLKKEVQAGKVRSDRPIHIIGHSAGGFVGGECALTLKKKGAPWVSQVTMLDTPHPVRSHFTQYPDPGKVERYISSLLGRFAPVVDAIGCNEDLVALLSSVSLINLDAVGFISCIIEVDQSSFYRRETIYPLWNVLHYFDHGGAHEWYTETIGSGLEDGFWYSPWRGNDFPTSPGLMPELASDGFRTASLPGEPVAGFTSFGQVAITNGAYTVTETTDGGIYKALTVPVGAQELRFRYQFRIAGDGDVLNVFWGTNALLYVGLDNDLSRTGWMEAEVPVSEIAGQTNNLVFKLVARGQTNAVLVLDGIEMTLSQDPDGDGLLTADEDVLGTNPLAYDSDFDGLNDGDEVNVYRTNPLLADTDGDGISDRNEVRAGTDPTRSNSVLKLTSVRLNPDQSISLAWQGATNRFYRVNRSVELGSDNFSTRTNGLPASVPVTTFTEPLGTNAMQFYWIELE